MLQRLLLIGFLLLSGCASFTSSTRSSGSKDLIELTDTPFFPQTKYHCGPAALATVLTQSGFEVEPSQLISRVFLPGRKGSLQSEMLATVRQLQRIPVKLAPDTTVLKQTLAANKPVLVLQNFGTRNHPYWHYAVMIGYDPAKDKYILRSGTTSRKITSARRFQNSWDRAGRWAVVVLSPGEMIDTVSQLDYLQSLSDLEQTSQLDSAIQGYQAAISRWPDSDMALVGMGNAYYGRGDFKQSETAFINAIKINTGNVIAYNNLATVLAEQGCRDAALHQIDQARRLTLDSPEYAQTVNQTYLEIVDKNGATIQQGGSCPQVLGFH